MPYCTIEEAWNTSIDPSLLDIDNARDPEQDYQNIHLENSEIFNSRGQSIECKKPKQKQVKKGRNMSRTYNRLSEHSGPKSRFTSSQKKIIHNNNRVVLNDSPANPNLNTDLPINEYNLDMYEKLNDEYKIQSEDLSSKGSILHEFKSINKSDNNTTNITNNIDENFIILNELRKENTELRQLINELKNNKLENSDNFMDLITFIITGIIVILMMENITALLRKF
jgi:hypothetical protein